MRAEAHCIVSLKKLRKYYKIACNCAALILEYYQFRGKTYVRPPRCGAPDFLLEEFCMGKSLFIAEKPSVARQFAEVFSEPMKKCDGYQESEHIVVTWCFGHLITMSYPEVYDPKYKSWREDTLPFMPEKYKYEVIGSSAKQFDIVKGLLNRPDVDRIYVCTDSGREGEYIYRLVRQEAGVTGKDERRVWINSQTEDEIKRGIKEAKPISEYDNLSDAAYLRAEEDYLMGINFSRILTLRHGRTMASFLHQKYCVVSVGRVMTCVLGMVVKREREIRGFTKTPFYRVTGNVLPGVETEWKAVGKSVYRDSPLLYKENGFKKREDAEKLIAYLATGRQDEAAGDPGGQYAGSRALPQAAAAGLPAFDEDGTISGLSVPGKVSSVSRKQEKKNPPLLYNLAELQSDCAKLFHISPDETLNTIQELYEKRLLTYPRTDARVLSSAIAKVIDQNIKGLLNIPSVAPVAKAILDKGTYKGIEKTRYTDDSKITDHYAIIPTGQGLGALKGLSKRSLNVYEVVVRRFLAIFCPPAVYRKVTFEILAGTETFSASSKVLEQKGYLSVMNYSFRKKGAAGSADAAKAADAGNGPAETSVPAGSIAYGSSAGSVSAGGASDAGADEDSRGEEGDVLENTGDPEAVEKFLSGLKKGQDVTFSAFSIREGETSPPKRYTTGSMILAMENAGNLIEDEELREQIKSCGIGTSATRADILKKLVEKNHYLSLNKKNQVLTPTLLGEMVTDAVTSSIPSLLSPKLTASWEKGLNGVADGSIDAGEYGDKLGTFITKHVNEVKGNRNSDSLLPYYRYDAQFYGPGAIDNSAGDDDEKEKKKPRRRAAKKKE